MSDKTNGVIGILLFAVILGLLLMVSSCTTKSDQQQIQDWAKQNGYIEVISIETPGWLESTPFWFSDEDARIYKATLKNRREERELKWVRFQYFGMEVK
jgi:hypothetical protein